MTPLIELKNFLDAEYPISLAEDWDNVGLLIGQLDATVNRVLTCLTITPDVCDEVIREGIDLIVSHHPFPFHALRRITSETVEGQMLLRLIAGGVAVYSPHTAHDSAPDGVNRQLATLFDLVDVEALNENASGRIGNRVEPVTLRELCPVVRERFGTFSCIGDETKIIRRIALGCGAADDFIDQAHRRGADLLVLGEARFHGCLQAESLGLALISTTPASDLPLRPWLKKFRPGFRGFLVRPANGNAIRYELLLAKER